MAILHSFFPQRVHLAPKKKAHVRKPLEGIVLLAADDPSNVEAEAIPLTVLIIGVSGFGKSTLGNTLIGRTAFDVGGVNGARFAEATAAAATSPDGAQPVPLDYIAKVLILCRKKS